MKKAVRFLVLGLFLIQTLPAASEERVNIEPVSIAGLPIFAGFGDTASDFNRVIYADVVCRYLGYSEAGNYTNGSSISDKGLAIAVVTEAANGHLTVRTSVIGSSELPMARFPAIYSELQCIR